MTSHPALLSNEEKLKAALYHSVSKICKSTGNDNSLIGQCSFDKNALELIAEIIYKKLELYSEDLEAFAKNRKQTTINIEDVKLLARRNPHMQEHLSKFIDNAIAQKIEKKKKKGKIQGKKELPSSELPGSSRSKEIIELD